MHIYGRKWDEALHKILMRLALDEGYGFLVIEGPDASGKTDLINLVREITENKSTILELHDEETRRLGQMVYARRYLKIALEDASEGYHSIPTRMLGKLVDAVSSGGAQPGQRFLITWDDINKSLDTSWHKEGNQQFLEEIHRPLQMYEHLTFLCSVTSVHGEGSEVLGTSAGSDHFLQL